MQSGWVGMAHLTHHLQLTAGTVWGLRAAGDLIKKRRMLHWGQGSCFGMLCFYCTLLTLNINVFPSS